MGVGFQKRINLIFSKKGHYCVFFTSLQNDLFINNFNVKYAYEPLDKIKH